MIHTACSKHYHTKCKGIVRGKSGDQPCTCACHQSCNKPWMALHTEACPIGQETT